MTSDAMKNNPLCANKVVLNRPYDGEVRRDVAYGDAQQLMDIYYPKSVSVPPPVVLLVTGYPDPGFEAMTGIKMKAMGQLQSWASLLAASGMAAVTYSTVDPVQDVESLLAVLERKQQELGIDMSRLAVWSASGNVPNALHVLQQGDRFDCAVLCYGFMWDAPDKTWVTEAAAQFRFVNPNSATMELPVRLGLFVLRAGQEQFAGVNESIDYFVADSVARNRDIELINFPSGVHAFDILDNSVQSIALVRRMVDYLQTRLRVKRG